MFFTFLTPDCKASTETGRRGMVVSQHPLASEVGLSILKQGGNAVDAAVATAFALGVVEPYHSGIGGGSFILIRNAGTGETVAIDAREEAPMAARRDMFRRNGVVVEGLSTKGPLAVAVPGTVAGLALALEKYGTMSLREVMEPSIRIAEEGVEIDPFFHDVLVDKRDLLARDPETASIYLKTGSEPHPAGFRLIQSDLAGTYRKIAEGGPEAFYRGEIAAAIAACMKKSGGIITRDDLIAYAPIVREPVRGTYRGLEVVSMPPPSSGGVHLVQILNMMEGFDPPDPDASGPDIVYLQHLIESMRLAFRDRALYLGDPDFVEVPVDRLLSKEYARGLRESLKGGGAGEGETGDDGDQKSSDGGTSHLGVIDADGNMVSLTQTINLWFGSGVTVPGTGIILNDEMDDFSAMPGVPNEFGLVGSEANAIEPGKRPLSSMCPTVILRDGKPFLILGSRGGPRIITSVLQVALNVIDFGMDPGRAIEAPRVHHQWLPDLLYVEKEFPPDLRLALEGRGYRLEEMKAGIGCVSGILVDEEGRITGIPDPRGIGAARGY